MEKITKNNYLQTKDTIIEGLNNFIDYCNNHLEYIGFYQNLSFYNSEYTEVIENLYNLRDFCYNGKTKNIKMNTLEEQNNQLKKYPHFDCSVKKPKYLGEYA